ncbi:MAG: HAD family phosphatase [Gemmatimonadetes bacterium]|nr:HAD family phosphatase [Gemmatimonadota bacterium]MBT7863070.1 HAD family phosphatase [Gemmatimonadota bacterium]
MREELIANTPIEAVLFDLGGVVFDINFGQAFSVWAVHSGTEMDDLAQLFSFDDAYMRHERGEIDAHAYFLSLARTMEIDITEAEWVEGWNAIYGDEFGGMAELLREIGESVPIYAFSNSNPTHQEVWEQKYHDTLDLFRGIFVSSDMGVRKPEAKSYQAVAARIGVVPEMVLFFDDTHENVTGAETVGMSAIHVGSIEDIRSAANRIL